MTEIDLSKTIAPKSDQLNADDLVAGPLTVRIVDIKQTADEKQPIWIYLAGYDGRPWKPCLTQRRVLVQLWGKDGKAFLGRTVELIRDPKVIYGGQNVGGIRIQGLSDMANAEEWVVVSESQKKRTQYLIRRIEAQTAKSPTDLPPGDLTKALLALENTATGEDRKNILKGLRAKFTWTDDEGKAIVAKITEMGKADRAQKTSTEPKNEDELP